MPPLTALQALPLQLEAYAPYIAETVEADGELARYLGHGGRGAHLLKEQQIVQIMSPAYVLRGTAQIQQVFKGLGQTQQVQVDAVPGGVVAGDLVIVAGAAQGAPQFVNGIPVFVSTSTVGNLYGISRALPYAVANGVNLSNNSQVTKPVFRIAQNQIIQRLGVSKLKTQIWHTHPSHL